MKKITIESTGERLVPELDKGAGFFYEHLARYIFTLQLVKNKNVLDVACGVGYGTYLLSEYGQAQRVVGVDISKESIEYANSKYKKTNNDFCVDDAEILKTAPNQSFDVAVSFETIEHLNNQEKFLSEIERVLKKDGVFVVSTPNKYTYPSGNKFHTKELYPEEFEALLKAHFKNIRTYHQSYEFSQSIKTNNLDSFEFEGDYCVDIKKVYEPPVNPKKTQFILAVCSNSTIPNLNTIAINSFKVDGYDFSKGILSLSGQFEAYSHEMSRLSQESSSLQILIQEKEKENRYLHGLIDNNMSEKSNLQEVIQDLMEVIEDNRSLMHRIHEYTLDIINIETNLDKIKSSKFFIMWQLFNKLKIFRKKNED